MYSSVFILIVAIISVSYRQPKETSAVSNAINSNSSLVLSDQTSVDTVLAASIAAGAAQIANLPIVDIVSNSAVSAQITSSVARSESITSAKPQLIESVAENRLVKSYNVLSGDTLESLSAKFGITAQTIKWANNMSSNVLTVGSVVKILPINGVLYTVTSDDTIDSIAKEYSVDKARVILYNDLEVSGLTSGSSIILPDGILPENERPGYVAPYVYTIAYGYSGGDVTYLNTPMYWNDYSMSDAIRSLIPQISVLNSRSDGNTMTLGNCTWWAWERRLALGHPLPSGYIGNAWEWYGKLVGGYQYKSYSIPEPGDVFQGGNHVGIVESVSRDASGNVTSFTSSEMNYSRTYVVVARTILASNFGQFNFIRNQ